MLLEANRRGTLFIYTLLGVTLGSLILAGTITSGLAAVLLAMYLAFIALTAFKLPARKPRTEKPRALRITQAARDAADNAPARTYYLEQHYILQDIGLVIEERRRDGLQLRRARFMSLDDESLRPYLVVYLDKHIPPYRAVIRFEINDASGKPQLIYEMEHKLRNGENLIIPDYRLPLKNNKKLTRTGTWDLDIKIDGQSVGVHSFSLLPSMVDRLKQSSDEGEIAYDRLILDEQEQLPVSLEELLRGR